MNNPSAHKVPLLVLLGVLVTTIILVVITRETFLLTQLALPPPISPPVAVSGTLLTQAIPPGDHTLTLNSQTIGGLNASVSIPFTLQTATPTPTPDPGGGGGGGGGGSDGGEGDGEERADVKPVVKPRKTVTLHEGKSGEATTKATYTEERSPSAVSAKGGGFTFTGVTAYASLKHTETVGKKTEVAVLLPHGKVSLQRSLSLPKGTYLISLRGRSRGPGPSLVRLSAKGKSLGTVSFTGTYGTQVVGVVSHAGGILQLTGTFLNDYFTCTPKDLQANQTLHCNRDALVSDAVATLVSGVVKKTAPKTP